MKEPLEDQVNRTFGYVLPDFAVYEVHSILSDPRFSPERFAEFNLSDNGVMSALNRLEELNADPRVKRVQKEFSILYEQGERDLGYFSAELSRRVSNSPVAPSKLQQQTKYHFVEIKDTKSGNIVGKAHVPYGTLPQLQGIRPHQIVYDVPGKEYWSMHDGDMLLNLDMVQIDEASVEWVYTNSTPESSKSAVVGDLVSALGLTGGGAALHPVLGESLPYLFEGDRIKPEPFWEFAQSVYRGNIGFGDFVWETAHTRALDEAIRAHPDFYFPFAIVSRRAKQAKSMLDKMVDAFNDIKAEDHVGSQKSFRDFFGIRLIVENDNVLDYLIAEIIDFSRERPEWFYLDLDSSDNKDYRKMRVTTGELEHLNEILTPGVKINGYQSVHLMGKWFGHRWFEIQGRTQAQDQAAESEGQAHDGQFAKGKSSRRRSQSHWTLPLLFRAITGVGPTYQSLILEYLNEL